MTRITTTFFCLFALLCNFAVAQNVDNQSVNDLRDKYAARITVNPATDNAGFIRFPADAPLTLRGATLEAKAAAFFTDFGAAFGIDTDRKELETGKSERDAYGKSHLLFNQKINDIPVFGGELRLHFDESEALTAANGAFISDIYVSPLPDIAEEEAREIGLALVDLQEINYSGVPVFVHEIELMYFHKGLVYNEKSDVNLVWRMEIRNDTDVREYLFVNAHTGKLVEQYTGMPHAMDRRVYEGNLSTQVWGEGDVFPGTLTNWQQNEVVVSGQTYHFFNNAFGFTSYDNADAPMRTINNNPNVGCPNATWNGSTTNYCDGTATDDVIGHEWGHAYTEYTAGLIYAWQTGALNESYSDIWGETIDLLNNYEDTGEDLSLRTACSSSDRWRVGEDATAFGGAIRDMYDPTCNGDPGKVTDLQYTCSSGDNGGVHSNSGVNNHLYMLLTDGGTYNGQTITAIGFTKAAHIFWRALEIYLTPTSDFKDQADALEAACQDLIGVNLEGLTTDATPAGPSGEIITAADAVQLANALLATEMRTDPNCVFTPLLAKNEPEQCLITETEDAIFFEDFESGLGAFTTTDIPVNPGTWESRVWVADNSLPNNRPGTAAFGADPINGNCSSDLENGIIRLESPVINIPAARTNPLLLTFDHYVSTEANWDGANIKYSINDGTWTLLPGTAFIFNGYNGTINAASAGNDNPMEGQAAFTGSDGGTVKGSWGQSQISLTALGLSAGDNIRLRWEMGTDGCNGRDGWYVDNVKVFTCESALLPVELTDFRAAGKERMIVSDWRTENERNNAGFALERSLSPDENFTEVAYLPGAGNSSQVIDYQYEDKSVLPGITYYYRLRQTDYDGTESLSEIVKATVAADRENGVTLYPNPAQNTVNLQTSNGTEVQEISLLTADGKVIFTVKDANTTLDISALPIGMYWVKVQTASGISVEKLLKE